MDRDLQNGPFNMRGIFLSALLLASAAFAAGPMAPATSGASVIRSVRVDGTKSPVELKTQVGQNFDEATIQSDVRRLWATGRFDDIRVESKPQDQGTAVIFHVVEAPQLQLHELHVEPSTYGLQMNLPEGIPMSPLRAHQIAYQAEQDLRSDGFRTATVDYNLVPYAGNKVDLHLDIDAGQRIRVKEVDFSGNTAFDTKDLRGQLRGMKIRRVIPPIPGIWAGWRMYPGYSPDAVQGDLALLRSYYISKGYFDANVKLNDVQVDKKDARVNIQVDSGQLYHVRTWQVMGNGVLPKVVHPEKELMRSQNFCSTLFVARRNAERAGILDFTVNLQVQPTMASTKEAPEADLAATVDRGKPFHVGRIEFIGNKHFTEAAVRSNFLLDEGDLLDEHQLRKSMARLNEARLFAPIGEHNAMIRTDPDTGIADIDIRVVEQKHGSWNISGPVGPVSVAGPVEASVRMRLPAWGSGILEASTYTASLSMFAFLHTFLPIAGIPKVPLIPIAALNRPYTPGEGWKSGFSIIPQLGWEYMVMGYGAAQLEHRLVPVLEGDRGLEPEIPVTVDTPSSRTTMLCEPPTPKLWPVREALVIGLHFIGSMAGI